MVVLSYAAAAAETWQTCSASSPINSGKIGSTRLRAASTWRRGQQTRLSRRG
jgi:hypothetical protein